MKYNNFEKIVNHLIDKNKSISTMESCTGGLIASEITNIPNASNIIKFSAVTYSNEYKIKMGVDPGLIDKFSVYSMEVAKDMSYKISKFAGSDIGVGVTGKLGKKDPANPRGEDNKVFISLYDKDNNKYFTGDLTVNEELRIESKKKVLDKFIELFNEMED
jgi:nicotinamide-nucleotide amidase